MIIDYSSLAVKRAPYIDNLLEDGAEADSQCVGLLFQQIVALLRALQTLFHPAQRPASHGQPSPERERSKRRVSAGYRSSNIHIRINVEHCGEISRRVGRAVESMRGAWRSPTHMRDGKMLMRSFPDMSRPLRILQLRQCRSWAQRRAVPTKKDLASCRHFQHAEPKHFQSELERRGGEPERDAGPLDVGFVDRHGDHDAVKHVERGRGALRVGDGELRQRGIEHQRRRAGRRRLALRPSRCRL